MVGVELDVMTNSSDAAQTSECINIFAQRAISEDFDALYELHFSTTFQTNDVVDDFQSMGQNLVMCSHRRVALPISVGVLKMQPAWPSTLSVAVG